MPDFEENCTTCVTFARTAGRCPTGCVYMPERTKHFVGQGIDLLDDGSCIDSTLNPTSVARYGHHSDGHAAKPVLTTLKSH